MREVIGGPDFENEVRDMYELITPICILINKCQDPEVNIADATQMWPKLELPTDRYNDLIRERIETAIMPVGYAANYLHHEYKGTLLDKNQLVIADTFLYDHLDNQGLDELEDFRNNRESHNYLSENCEDPLSFLFLVKYKYPNLADFAMNIFTIPASSARIEGFFSQWTFLHNKYRNRLKNFTSAQLVDVYNYLTATAPKSRKKPKKKAYLW